ncbi:uncharacterized [Tachysurus ichikawai]
MRPHLCANGPQHGILIAKVIWKEPRKDPPQLRGSFVLIRVPTSGRTARAGVQHKLITQPVSGENQSAVSVMRKDGLYRLEKE